MASGLCECGCGERTRIAACSDKRRGHVKGQPLRFVHGHRTRLAQAPTRCDSDDRRDAREARWRIIAAMWREGRSVKWIAAELGSTAGSIKVTVSRMRREGFTDVPYRRQPRKLQEAGHGYA